MTKASLKLRAISAQGERYAKPFTAFVAMTDVEFVAFRTTRPFSLVPYRHRVVSVVPRAAATDVDKADAEFAFAHTYGNRAYPRR